MSRPMKSDSHTFEPESASRAERRTVLTQPPFLPMTPAEMEALGWRELDVLLISGDAYVDHPAFGEALLGRWLVARGYRVGVIAQPAWDGVDAVKRMGRPRLFAGVTAGALDSMVAHYTSFRKKRSNDAYTPGGRAGARPNRATIVYVNLVKQAFPGLPVVIGGIEASLRRAVHYDFWSDKLRRSILPDSKADLLVYGMGERAVEEIARRLERSSGGEAEAWKESLKNIPGTVYIGQPEDVPPHAEVMEIPSYEEIRRDPAKLMAATLALEDQVHRSLWAEQKSGDRSLVFAPPSSPLTTGELDALYALPFARLPHPSYKEPIPASEMIESSVTTHRGCGGGCSFCSLALHQGRRVRSRSGGSILREVEELTRHPRWRGAISDVGGPSANMWGASCQGDLTACRRPSCLYPSICAKFKVNQQAIIDLLRSIKTTPGVGSVRVASGVRFDLALQDPRYVRALVREFVGGQLKVAPESLSAAVLKLMRKPKPEVFRKFVEVFQRESRGAGKEQYLVPYLIDAFPGCSDRETRETASWFGSRGWRPRQTQLFLPTPGTVATAMYYAGVDPQGRPISVARTDKERLRLSRSRALGGSETERPDGGRPAGKRKPRDKAGKGRSKASV